MKKLNRPQCSGACQHKVGWSVTRNDNGATIMVCSTHIAWACRGGDGCVVREVTYDEKVVSEDV